MPKDKLKDELRCDKRASTLFVISALMRVCMSTSLTANVSLRSHENLMREAQVCVCRERKGLCMAAGCARCSRWSLCEHDVTTTPVNNTETSLQGCDVFSIYLMASISVRDWRGEVVRCSETAKVKRWSPQNRRK